MLFPSVIITVISIKSPLIPLRSPCKLKVDDVVDSTFALFLCLFLINIWITKQNKYALKNVIKL